MSDSNISLRAGFETERSVTVPFSGSNQNVGTPLDHQPVIIIFDNQSDVTVGLYVNGINWKTFEAGEALLLDLRANHGNAPNFTIDKHTQFAVIGTAGTTGGFYISTVYAR